MNHDGDQWGGHVWKTGEDDIGNTAEVSNSPVGKYTVTKGAGSLKWAVNHEKGWEALGRTRKEVRAEADSHAADLLKKKDN